MSAPQWYVELLSEYEQNTDSYSAQQLKGEILRLEEQAADLSQQQVNSLQARPSLWVRLYAPVILTVALLYGVKLVTEAPVQNSSVESQSIFVYSR